MNTSCSCTKQPRRKHRKRPRDESAIAYTRCSLHSFQFAEEGDRIFTRRSSTGNNSEKNNENHSNTKSMRTSGGTHQTYRYARYTKCTTYLFLLLLLDASILHPVHSKKPQLPSSNPQHSSNLHSQLNANVHANANNNEHVNTVSTRTNQPATQSKQLSKERKQKSSLVEVYEHEYYCKQTNTWLGGTNTHSSTSNSTSTNTTSSTIKNIDRWTSSPKTTGRNIKILPPPSELSAPRGYSYVGQWKIDITGEGRKDDLGWEYYVSSSNGSGKTERVGRRRRRWLRNVVLMEVSPVQYVEEKESEDEDKDSDGVKMRDQDRSRDRAVKSKDDDDKFASRGTAIVTPKRPSSAAQKVLKQLSDSFAFKGYGITATKSILSRRLGMSFRLPLSSNFDFWESRPFLPSLTTSIGVYFPLQLSLFVNATLPLELLQTAIWASFDWSLFICTMLYCIILQTIVWDIVGKMVLWNSIKATGKILALGPIDDAEDSDTEEGELIEQKRDVKERMESWEEQVKLWWKEDGTSLSVLGRTYPSVPTRRRVAYKPSIADRLGVTAGVHLSKSRGFELRWSWWHMYLPTVDFLQTKFLPNTRKRKQDMYQRMIEKFASLGIVWGGFTPEAPHYSCSSIFTLSGIYPGDAWKRFCEIKEERKSRGRINKTLDSRLKNAEGMVHSESEYEEIIEVKVGAS